MGRGEGTPELHGASSTAFFDEKVSYYKVEEHSEDEQR
jgi:hypothetical protein